MPKKNFGQNFIFDSNITDRITKYIHRPGGVALEIGPGPGGLTRSLLKLPFEKVIAIEKDERFKAVLDQMVLESEGKLVVLYKDALETSLKEIGPGPLTIVANLPYNIATPLLIKWIHEIECVKSMTLMFQKEVALRIVASPRTKDYGRLSIISQWATHAKKLFDVNPQVFYPPPKVYSSIVQLIPKDANLNLLPYLEKVTQASFAYRRKILRRNLEGLFAMEILESYGILPKQRAEELTLDQFIKLAQALKDHPDF